MRKINITNSEQIAKTFGNLLTILLDIIAILKNCTQTVLKSKKKTHKTQQ